MVEKTRYPVLSVVEDSQSSPFRIANPEEQRNSYQIAEGR
jgi:hypothetical protein